MSRRQIESLAQIRGDLVKLDPSHFAVDGAWSVAQVLSHCAQSIEYSLIGFPVNKPAWFQATLGRIVLAKFLRQGYMTHDITGPIPGAPPPANMEPQKAVDRLIAAIDKFEAHAEPFAPHFAYGAVDKARYGRVQAMHIAQHLESFRQVAANGRKGVA